jgi:hypothetical protein
VVVRITNDGSESSSEVIALANRLAPHQLLRHREKRISMSMWIKM